MQNCYENGLVLGVTSGSDWAPTGEYELWEEIRSPTKSYTLSIVSLRTFKPVLLNDPDLDSALRICVITDPLTRFGEDQSGTSDFESCDWGER